MAQTAQKQLYVNVDRCVGCYACELSCKEERSLEGVKVFPVGPKKVTFFPVYTNACDFCAQRVKEGLAPVCVSRCFTKAIYYGDKPEAGKKPVIYGIRPSGV